MPVRPASFSNHVQKWGLAEVSKKNIDSIFQGFDSNSDGVLWPDEINYGVFFFMEEGSGDGGGGGGGGVADRNGGDKGLQERHPDVPRLQAWQLAASQLCRWAAQHQPASTNNNNNNNNNIGGGCVDGNDTCEHWASLGECKKNPAYMESACRLSCGVCKKDRTEL